ncbi:MAG: TonB-dependent receptor [Edaphocola sp.]
MKNLLLSVSFAGYAINVSAQEAVATKLAGIVKDARTNEVLAGATVTALPNGMASLSDENGNFEFHSAAAITKVVASYTGYVNDTLDAADGLRFLLKPDERLAEVTIEHRKKSTDINLLDALKTENIGTRELLKAACCNLSESFETTPSVDVGFTDAVSGYKQIQMLGLAGTHTSFTREAIPDIRGLAAITGLTFTPGAWVQGMQLSKGAGSVVNGFEGTAGQINVEWQKPFDTKSPKVYLNGYQNVQGRTEGNAVINHKFGESLSTNLLLHGRSDWARIDQNGDGFMDQPLGQTFVGANRWFYFSPKGVEFQAGIKAVRLDNTGGQKTYTKGTEQISGNPWGYTQSLQRYEAWAKIGKVYTAKPWKSMGLQLAGTYHDQDNNYGRRSYAGKQKSLYANYIFQTILNNTNHTIKAGASYLLDNYDETFAGALYGRTESVPGIFTEYSYKYLTKFNIVAGLRADYHNLFGLFVTPRLHVRYAPTENSALRASIGRAQRASNVFAENMGYLASNRSFLLQGNEADYPYGLKPEVAWNMGLNFTQKFMLDYRDGTFGADYYYTNFTNQVVTDIETPGQVSFYNLNGKSFSHSFQAQLDYEVVHNWDLRLAYRFYDVRTTYNSGKKPRPLVAKHRAFLNTAYHTKNHWKFDYTVQWIGAKRLPERYATTGNTILASGNSPSYVQMNAQISKSWENEDIEVYAGGENLTGYMQHHIVNGAQNPFGENFDASLVWGPAMGRNFYVGFRYKIK